jgi:aminoglycoside phosphotransferase (APT) family kinase protein
VTEVRPGRLIAEGREAEVYEWGDGTVLRLMRLSDRAEEMRRSAVAVGVAHAAGVPVPEVIDEVEVDGRPGLVMRRVDGPDLMTTLTARPWTMGRLARKLGTLHAALHEVGAPTELPSLHEYVRDRVSRAPALPKDLARFALERLAELPAGDRLCHGDFHPGNVIIGSDGPVIIDWTNVSRGTVAVCSTAATSARTDRNAPSTATSSPAGRS